jgi:DNA ligase-1
VGAYFGKGKRTNVYGAYLLACYDADNEEYQTICKIGTGFSEEALQAHHKDLQPLELTKPRGDIKVGGAKPDVWFEPKVVWEVLAADLSLSPIYTAANGIVRTPLSLFLCLSLMECVGRRTGHLSPVPALYPHSRRQGCG